MSNKGNLFCFSFLDSKHVFVHFLNSMIFKLQPTNQLPFQPGFPLFFVLSPFRKNDLSVFVEEEIHKCDIWCLISARKVNEVYLVTGVILFLSGASDHCSSLSKTQDF